jgi:diguanylate cyclase (GGDEF)-like protein
MNQDLVNRIRTCPTLPSLPSVAIQVLDLAQKDSVDLSEIAVLISKDPALSSKILRTVNSSFYGRPQRISAVSRALVVLGLQSVKTLVLGFSLVNTLTKEKTAGFNHLKYWRRAIYAATAARLLAAKLHILQQEECFLAALLKDIGMLVLSQVLGSRYGQICQEAKSHRDLLSMEQRALELTHADVGGIMAEHWNLPPLLAIPITHHHGPAEVKDASLRRMTEVIHLAGRCADLFVDEDAATGLSLVRQICQDTFRINQKECDAMLDQIGRRTQEIAPLFEISLNNANSFESILERANEALVALTLQSQQQANTLQQQASSLQQQNQALLKAATTDALTGLANRATFEEFLTTNLGECVAASRPLALLMMDVDKFKSINDRFGHPGGDQVLRYVGRLLRAMARKQDLAGRYGGEEVVLVMPGTTRPEAISAAEKFRRALASRPVECGDGQTTPVTISIGIAVCDSAGLLSNAAQLIKAADLAVYAAKNAGRNCVRVFVPKAPAASAA